MSQFDLNKLIQAALTEDIGAGDLTSNITIPEEARCEARLIAKQDGVLSGVRVFHRTFDLVEAALDDWNGCFDGERFVKGDAIATFTGNVRAVLAGERVALNFLQHLSGIATMTADYVAAVGDNPCRICDTRKTTPLLRHLEKEAIVHGGGTNHRFNLATGILIKENHIEAAGGVAHAVRQARAAAPHLMRVEVEVTNLDELDAALDAGAEVVMLDNMDNEMMRTAVARARQAGHPVMLEASGNATLERIPGMAATGVDLISVGAITHSAPSIDFSLLIQRV